MLLKCPSCGHLNEYEEAQGKAKCSECGISFIVRYTEKKKPFYTRGESGILNSGLYSSYPKKSKEVNKSEI